MVEWLVDLLLRQVYGEPVCLLVLALIGWSLSLSLETVGVVPAGGLVV